MIEVLIFVVGFVLGILIRIDIIKSEDNDDEN